LRISTANISFILDFRIVMGNWKEYLYGVYITALVLHMQQLIKRNYSNLITNTSIISIITHAICMID